MKISESALSRLLWMQFHLETTAASQLRTVDENLASAEVPNPNAGFNTIFEPWQWPWVHKDQYNKFTFKSGKSIYSPKNSASNTLEKIDDNEFALIMWTELKKAFRQANTGLHTGLQTGILNGGGNTIGPNGSENNNNNKQTNGFKFMRFETFVTIHKVVLWNAYGLDSLYYQQRDLGAFLESFLSSPLLENTILNPRRSAPNLTTNGYSGTKSLKEFSNNTMNDKVNQDNGESLTLPIIPYPLDPQFYGLGLTVLDDCILFLSSSRFTDMCHHSLNYIYEDDKKNISTSVNSSSVDFIRQSEVQLGMWVSQLLLTLWSPENVSSQQLFSHGGNVRDKNYNSENKR